jgi:gluconokinase
MRAGRALDDEARMPWLRAVRELIIGISGQGVSAVVACSALKESYRALLLDGIADVQVVHLTAPAAVLRSRVAHREGHFMPARLVDSQVAALESPDRAMTVDATLPVADVVQRIVVQLGLAP